MNFEITQWHKDNPNDWCFIASGRIGKPPILFARAKTLKKLLATGKGGTLVKAWGHGISKDYPITDL